jgi:hypothetical protein
VQSIITVEVPSGWAVDTSVTGPPATVRVDRSSSQFSVAAMEGARAAMACGTALEARCLAVPPVALGLFFRDPVTKEILGAAYCGRLP